MSFLSPDLDLNRLAESLAGYSGADVAEVCERCAARVFVESIHNGTDVDYYQYTAPGSGKLIVNMYFDSQVGDINVDEYAANWRHGTVR